MSGWQKLELILNTAGNVRTMECWGAFMQIFLLCQSNKHYILSGCVCSVRYPACNAYASCYQLWPTPLYNISPPYVTKGTIKKKLLKIKTCFNFFKTFDWNISHSKNNWASLIKTYIGLHVKYPLFLYFDETWILAKEFRKKLFEFKFNENLPSGSRFV